MFEHYDINGSVTKLTTDQAMKKMNEISEQWEDEKTIFGKLFIAVYDWAFDKETLEILIPNLRTGGSVPKNNEASKKFGGSIFGDCFLKI